MSRYIFFLTIIFFSNTTFAWDMDFKSYFKFISFEKESFPVESSTIEGAYAADEMAQELKKDVEDCGLRFNGLNCLESKFSGFYQMSSNYLVQSSSKIEFYNGAEFEGQRAILIKYRFNSRRYVDLHSLQVFEVSFPLDIKSAIEEIKTNPKKVMSINVPRDFEKFAKIGIKTPRNYRHFVHSWEYLIQKDKENRSLPEFETSFNNGFLELDDDITGVYSLYFLSRINSNQPGAYNSITDFSDYDQKKFVKRFFNKKSSELKAYVVQMSGKTELSFLSKNNVEDALRIMVKSKDPNALIQARDIIKKGNYNVLAPHIAQLSKLDHFLDRLLNPQGTFVDFDKFEEWNSETRDSIELGLRSATERVKMVNAISKMDLYSKYYFAYELAYIKKAASDLFLLEHFTDVGELDLTMKVLKAIHENGWYKYHCDKLDNVSQSQNERIFLQLRKMLTDVKTISCTNFILNYTAKRPPGDWWRTLVSLKDLNYRDENINALVHLFNSVQSGHWLQQFVVAALKDINTTQSLGALNNL